MNGESTTPPSPDVPRIRRSHAERYDIRLPRPSMSWATIVVCEDGQVLVQSDYGDWAHWWSHHGREGIKHFLCEIDHWYLMNKLGKGQKEHFNHEQTVRDMRREIVRWRRDGHVEWLLAKLQAKGRGTSWSSARELARAAWDDLDQCGCHSIHDFCQGVTDSMPLSALFDLSELPLVTEPAIGLQEFAKRIWPVFVDELRKELGLPLPVSAVA